MNIDDTAWPLVIATMPSAATVESIDTLVDYFNACFARREKFALVIDTRAIHTIPDALWRKRLTEWINEPTFREKERRYNVGAATILSSSAVRPAMTALQWLWKPPSPQYYPSDLGDAVGWCVKQLTDARVPLTEPLRALHASYMARASGVR